MSTMPIDLSRVGRIAVLRALHLGDLLCAVPALRALRAGAPQAHITLVGLPWARSFARRFSAYVDDFLEFPGFRGFVEAEGDFRALRRFARTARRRRFDLVIQMHGSGERSNRALRLFGQAANAGYQRGGEIRDGFLMWCEQHGERERWLRLVETIGAPSCGEHLEWPTDEDDLRAASRLIEDLGLTGRRFACVHAGARLPSRRWPAERFSEVAAQLVRAGLPVVMTGTAGEAERVRQVIAHVPERWRSCVHDACGRTSVGSLAALVAQAEVVVSNDTGLSHVAAAVGTRSVVISSGGDASRWAPADGSRHRVLWHPTHCRPCNHAVCPTDHACARGVATRAVIEAVREQLNEEERRHAA